EGCVGLAIDSSGSIFFSGGTSSSDFPTSIAAIQTTYGGMGDAFLVKLNSNGTRAWATYYGGSSSEYGASVATDTAGDVILAGSTASTGLATTGAFQTTRS